MHTYHTPAPPPFLYGKSSYSISAWVFRGGRDKATYLYISVEHIGLLYCWRLVSDIGDVGFQHYSNAAL